MPTAVIFNHETVALDGDSFADCEFRNCRLVYAGGPPPSFDRCSFHDCDWRFEGAAQDTLAFLRLMWGAGAKPTVQGLIKEITGAGGR